MVDAFASEYGWDTEYIMDLPTDIVSQLMHSLLVRRGAKPRLVSLEVDDAAEPLATRLEGIWGKIDTAD